MMIDSLTLAVRRIAHDALDDIDVARIALAMNKAMLAVIERTEKRGTTIEKRVNRVMEARAEHFHELRRRLYELHGFDEPNEQDPGALARTYHHDTYTTGDVAMMLAEGLASGDDPALLDLAATHIVMKPINDAIGLAA